LLSRRKHMRLETQVMTQLGSAKTSADELSATGRSYLEN